MPAIPNLTDKVWLYGSQEATMIETVTKGRVNRMPAWGDFLGEAKVHLLAAYVWGLGGGVKPEPQVEAVAAPGRCRCGCTGAPAPLSRGSRRTDRRLFQPAPLARSRPGSPRR